jgi:hypothetical protein
MLDIYAVKSSNKAQQFIDAFLEEAKKQAEQFCTRIQERYGFPTLIP